jgi:hypothetical protein
MLENTIVSAGHMGGDNITLPLIDGPTNRRTLRADGDGSELSIAHTESNENPGFQHQRTNVRFSLTKVDEETSKPVIGYAQLTLGIPKTEFTAAEITLLVDRLLVFLLSPEGGSPVAIGSSSAPIVGRLYAQES